MGKDFNNLRYADAAAFVTDKESESESESKPAIKNRQEVSLVYCMNQTKRLMEKTKKKTIEQSGVRKGSPMEGVGSKAGRI